MAPKSGADDGPAKRGARLDKKQSEHFSKLEVDDCGSTRTISFYIKGLPLCLVNSVRRAIMADVKTVAVEFNGSKPVPFDIENKFTSGIFFKKNGSDLPNEKLGHCIAFVPICVSEDRLQGFDPNTYRFALKVKNDGSDVRTVTSNDIRVLDSTDAEVPTATRDALFPICTITKDPITIVRLEPSRTVGESGQEIDVEFRARLGSGRENARWSPVSLCFHKYVPDEKILEQNFKAFLEKKGGEGAFSQEEKERMRRQYATLEGHFDYAKDGYKDPVLVLETIESVKGLDPAYLFFEGLRVVSRMAADLLSEIKKLGTRDDGGWSAAQDQEDDSAPGRVTIVKDANMDDMYEIWVDLEDHTIGNVVHGLLYRHWNMDGIEGPDRGAAFFGYTVPHPDVDRMKFKITVNPGDKVDRLMEEGLKWCIDYVDEVSMEWAEFTQLHKIKVVDAALQSMRKKKTSGGWGLSVSA